MVKGSSNWKLLVTLVFVIILCWQLNLYGMSASPLAAYCQHAWQHFILSFQLTAPDYCNQTLRQSILGQPCFLHLTSHNPSTILIAYLVLLHWFKSWTGCIHSLDWTTGLEYCTGLLDWVIFLFWCLFLEISLHFLQSSSTWLLWMIIIIITIVVYCSVFSSTYKPEVMLWSLNKQELYSCKFSLQICLYSVTMQWHGEPRAWSVPPTIYGWVMSTNDVNDGIDICISIHN